MKKIASPVLFVVLLLLSIIISACGPTATATAIAQPTVPSLDIKLSADGKSALIPAGKFTMGNSAEDGLAECKKYRNDCDPAWFTVEAPAHVVDVAAFYLDLYEVTNANYKACETAGKCKPPRLTNSAKQTSYYGNAQFDNFPVIDVDWESANAYCTWAGGRLPTEAEWEKAARGPSPHIYPWGDDIDTQHANYFDSKVGDPVAVGSFESGRSAYGMYDMAGNVWEWMADWYEVYPGGDPKASPDFGQKTRALRGGAFLDPTNAVRVAYRGGLDPTHSFGNIGIRCAHDAK